MIYIIGSGLSATATAIALVQRGVRPTVLDVGLRSDPEKFELKTRLAAGEPDDWTPEDIREVKSLGLSARSGIPRKLYLGSSFPYQDIDKDTSPRLRDASFIRSFAHGGFSNVWGGVLGQIPTDLDSWPIAPERLGKHFSAIRKMLCPSDASIPPTAQGNALYGDLNEHRAKLKKAGIRSSAALLAVRTTDDQEGKGCRHCGLCLYGCPYDSIFSAASQMTKMARQGLIHYVPHILIDRIAATVKGIRIEGRSTTTGDCQTFNGGTVFIATGMLETARIILNSTNTSGIRLRVQQSDIFTIPMLRYHSSPGISRDRIHTLCQALVQIDDASICPRSVQLQLYGYNDLYSRIIADWMGRFSTPLRSLIEALSSRLLVAFGYLHSNVSSPVWLIRTQSDNGRLHLEGQINNESERVGRAVVKKLVRNRDSFRAIPIPRQLRFDLPGGGHRSGGCFPMRRAPAALETNEWGSIANLEHVHIVDSSIMPTVPAGPVAFTAMANAHRIASECQLHE